MKQLPPITVGKNRAQRPKSVSLENGEELHGHDSSRTIEIYTHVSTTHYEQIKNPLDDF